MLPKIISNITLALIAIFILYTIAPLLKDYLLMLFGAPKKKDYNKEEFEELVKRKAQMLSTTGRAEVRTSDSKNITSTRSDLDYLVDNNYFQSDSEKQLFFDLKKELSWGQGEISDRLKQIFNKNGLQAIEDKVFIQHIRNNLSKNSLLNLFPQKGVAIDSFFQIIGTTLLLSNLKNDEMLKSLAQSLLCTILELKLIIHITISKEQNQDCIHILEDYIHSDEVNCEEIKATKNLPLSEFINLLKKNIDIVIPLSSFDQNKHSSDIKSKKEDTDFIKKKHKRLLSLYHPDKWAFFEKTPVIDKRLRENFDKVQSIFKNL